MIAVPFTAFIIGDRFGSDELRVKPTVNDLFFGRLVNLVLSFLSDATILGVVRLFKLFSDTSSKP